MNHFFKILLCIMIFNPLKIIAQDSISKRSNYNELTSQAKNEIARILIMFKQNKFFHVIDELEKLKNEKEIAPLAHYWIGICYNRLSKFDSALKYFKKALTLNLEIEDIEYEMGQAYFASQELQDALKSFKKSIRKNYKPVVSVYYIANIYQILEENHKSLKYYSKIPKGDENIYQAAQFQIGQIIFEEVRKSQTPQIGVEKYVIPQLQSTIEINPNSKLALHVKKFLENIEVKYNLSPNIMVNGRKISTKMYKLQIKERYSYDSNVISEAENALSKSTNKDSQLSFTDLLLNYKIIFARQFVIEPSFNANYTRHAKRNIPTVHRNDNYSINPKLTLGVEHTLFGEQARIEFQSSYLYQARDVYMIHQLSFFGRTLEFSINEKMKIFSFGETDIKFKRKEFTANTKTLDSFTNSFSFIQSAMLFRSHLLIIIGSFDFIKVPLTPNNSTNLYVTRFDYVIPQLWWRFNSTIGLGLSVLDPRRQRIQRGYETNIAPSLELGVRLISGSELSFKYEYTKNYSKIKSTFQYNKQVISSQLKINF